MSNSPDDAPDDAPAEDVNNEDISEEEVEALLEKVEPGSGVVESYDLIAPDKILRARMPALDRVNERWVEQFQQTLTELVRRPVELSVEDARVVAYAEWQNSFEPSANYSLLTVQPLARKRACGNWWVAALSSG